MNKCIIWPEGAIDVWNKDDKSFMKARRQDWSHVKKSLSCLSPFISKKSHKQHKELFLTGDIVDTFDAGEFHGHELDYRGCHLIFQMWYYPDNDMNLFHQLVQNAAYQDITCARSQYTDYLKQQCAVDPSYGFMGGREENIFRALYPSYDYNDIKEYSPDQPNPIHRCPLHLGPDFYYILGLISTLNAVMYGDRVNRCYPGRYLWDYFDFAFSHIDLDSFNADIHPVTLSIFYNMLYLARDQKDVSRFAVKNTLANEVANEIKVRFEKRELCKNLLAVWDDLDGLRKRFPY